MWDKLALIFIFDLQPLEALVLYSLQSLTGEVIKPNDLKCVYGEGMPTYRNPFEKGKLVVKFVVDFPESLDPHAVHKLEALLPPK